MATRRIAIEEGISRRGRWLVAVVRMGSRKSAEIPPRQQKWPLGTDLRVLRAWRHRQQAEMLELRDQIVSPSSGSLAGDVPAFLELLPVSRRREDFDNLLQHWIACPLGAEPRNTITRDQILAQRSRWLESGAKIVTVNHRFRALRALYHTLDGLDVKHPTDGITYLRPPRRRHRFIPMEYVADILHAIPDRGRAVRHGTRPPESELKIRLRIMAWTGIPPMQLERLRPRDVDLVHERITLPPRHKGTGTGEKPLTLMPNAVDAFRDFARLGLWGKKFSRSSMGKSWAGGIRRVTAALEKAAVESGDRTELDAFLDAIPPQCRPYDLRHSFATEAYRISGDLGAVGELLQHASLETTKIYTGGAISERVSATIAAMAHKHQGPRTTPAADAPRLNKRGSLRSVK